MHIWSNRERENGRISKMKVILEMEAIITANSKKPMECPIPVGTAATVRATAKNIKDSDIFFSISIFSFPIWLVQNSWPWKMVVSSETQGGSDSSTLFSVQYMAPSLERRNAHYCTWQEIMSLANELCVFQLLACEHYEKRFALRWRSQQFTSTLLPQWDIRSLDQCHQLLCRNSDISPVCRQQITLIH